MKVPLLLSFVSFGNLLASVISAKLTCKEIPFETKDGLSGTCCVFYKNSNSTFPNEEVTRQILANGANNSDKRGNDDEKLVFSEERRKNEKESSSAGPAKKAEDDKLVFSDEKRRVDHKPHGTKGQNVSTSAKNVTIQNKNAFDTPEGCPEGQLKDHSGACTDPF